MLGDELSAQTRLCRYQDGTFEQGYSQGWSVVVATAGRYQLRINRGDSGAAGQLFVSWQNHTDQFPSTDGTATVNLRAGRGTLDIWFVADGQKRARPGDNSTLGDVAIRRID